MKLSRIEEIKKHIDSGASIRKVGRIMNVCESAVRSFIERQGYVVKIKQLLVKKQIKKG
jgi:hypothetical protein